MKSFSQFLRINEAEKRGFYFNGLKGDPYQYKVEAIYIGEIPDKIWLYYAKKSLGTLDAASDKWIEQTDEIGRNAISELGLMISTASPKEIKYFSGDKVDNVVKETTLDEKTKEKIMELQESLNKAKPIIPKLWVLPLKADGDFGWRTAFAFWNIMFNYNSVVDLDDVENYSKFHFDNFKSDEYWKSSEYPEFTILKRVTDPQTEVETILQTGEKPSGSGEEFKPGLPALDRFTKYIEAWTKNYKENSYYPGGKFYEGGKLNWDNILGFVNARIDSMLGNLPKGGYVDSLYCTKYVKSIPNGIKAGTIDIYPDSPITSIPKSITCDNLSVSSKKKIIIPKIDTNSISINGPSVLSSEWTQIDYLYIQENPSIGYITPTIDSIPSTLKEIGSLSLSAESITKIPDDLTIGIIKSSYVDPDPVINQETVVISGKESKINPIKVIKKRTPWWKRIFKEKNKNESIDTQLYEKFKITGDLSIQNCFNIKTLPTGLIVLGDFNIDGSGIQNNFTDDEIREKCDIKGKILRSGGQEGVLEIPNP